LVELFGLESADEFIGFPPEHFSPKYQPNGVLSEELAAQYMQKAFDIGSLKFEWAGYKADGRSFEAMVTLSVMTPDNKNLFMALIRDITSRKQAERRLEKLNRLNEQLLVAGSLSPKLELITDSVVEIFSADFARIWMIQPGDLCTSGCVHTQSERRLAYCQKDRCLHLMASSGRYTHIDGGHRRVPFGRYKIGRIVSGEDTKFVTREVAKDPSVDDREWAARLGLRSFAGYRLLSESGEPMGVLALFSKHDIAPEEDVLLEGIAATTAQLVQAEKTRETLKESEAFLDAIVENIPDMIFVKNAGNLSFTRFNRAGEELLGYAREDLYGKNDFDFFPEDEAKFFIQKDRDVLNSGSVLDIPEEEIHTRLKGARVLHTKKIPLLDEDGTPRYLLGISEDITEKQQAEEQQRLQAQIINQIHDSVIATDIDGFITSWNQGSERLFHYSAGDIIGKHVATLYPERTHQYLREDVIPTLLSKGSHGYEIPLVRKGGEEFPALVSLSVLKDKIGTVNGMIGYTLDNTEQKQAEAELQLRERLLEFAIEQMPMPVIIADAPDVSITRYNSHAVALLAKPAQDLKTIELEKHREFWPTFYPDGTPYDPDDLPLTRAIKRGDVSRDVEVIIRKEDQDFWVAASAAPLHDSEGNIIAGIVVFPDITDRIRAEKELRESRSIYKFLAENMADIVWTIDKEFKTTYISPSVEKVLGFTAKERKQQRLEDMVSTQSLEHIATKFIQELQFDQQPETDPDRSVTIEAEFYHKDGSLVWMQNNVKAIRDQAGQLIGMYGSSHDISDRKRAELALRESEEKFRAIFEQAAVGVAVTSAGTDEYIQINEKYCEIVGYSESELTPKTYRDITHPDDMQADRDNLRMLQQGQIQDFSMERRYLHKDGSTVWVNLTVSPLLKIEDRPTHYIAVIEDITARKLMEAEVKTLSGLLPICASCKKIRDDTGYWNQIETYIKAHSEADFSHSICPACAKELYPDIDIFKD